MRKTPNRVFAAAVLFAAIAPAGFAADSTGGAPAAGGKANTTPPPLVAGESLSVDKLHIGSQCVVAGGKAVISGDIPTRRTDWGSDTDVGVYFDKNFLQDVKIDETERQTRLWSDLGALASSIAAAPADPCEQVHVTKKLRFKRATVKITGVDLKGNDAQSVTVITGPVEHAFLGLDLPVSNRKTLKYDAASKSLQPASDSPQFYLSLNFLIGDVLSPAANYDSNFYKNISIKLFVSANSKPLDSLGAGLGYRMPELNLGTFDLSALSIYGGYFWTKQDSTSSNGLVQVNGGWNKGFRFGVTYDIASTAHLVKW